MPTKRFVNWGAGKTGLSISRQDPPTDVLLCINLPYAIEFGEEPTQQMSDDKANKWQDHVLKAPISEREKSNMRRMLMALLVVSILLAACGGGAGAPTDAVEGEATTALPAVTQAAIRPTNTSVRPR